MQIMKFHDMKFPTGLHFFICLRFKCSPWQFVFKPSIYRVSERSMYTWHICLFHHTCISFDPAYLCRHPHGQQRAWYIATSFASSSVELKEVKASVMMASFYQTQSNVVLHVLPLVSVHTWVVKVQGEWLQWYMSQFGICDWLLHRESFTFPYENAHFSCDKRVTLCQDGLSNHYWNGVITSFITWPELSLYASQLATKCSTMEQLLVPVIISVAQHRTNNEKMQPCALGLQGFVTCALSHRVAKSCKVIKCRHNEINK